MLTHLWDVYQTSQAYALRYCPDQGPTADVGSFVDDLETTTHEVDNAHVEKHQDMGDNHILDLKGLKSKISKKSVIVGRRKAETLALQEHYKKKGVQTTIKNAAKYLGLATTSRVKRSMVTIKDRIKPQRKEQTK